MARITVTIPIVPEIKVSGTLISSIFSRPSLSPSWSGDVVLGVDRNNFEIRIGESLPRVRNEPPILITEDSEFLFISEDSIFSDSLQIVGSIKSNSSDGTIFQTNSSGQPIISSTADQTKWVEILESNNSVVDINRSSTIAVFEIIAPRRSYFSYTFSDVLNEESITLQSYYSLDSGSTWIEYSGGEFYVPVDSYGRIVIYCNISTIVSLATINDYNFYLNSSISDYITYLIAEDPDVISPIPGRDSVFDILSTGSKLRRTVGSQLAPIPYGTFKECVNNNGLARFYGSSSIQSITSGSISYSYSYFESIHPRCLKNYPNLLGGSNG